MINIPFHITEMAGTDGNANTSTSNRSDYAKFLSRQPEQPHIYQPLQGRSHNLVAQKQDNPQVRCPTSDLLSQLSIDVGCPSVIDNTQRPFTPDVLNEVKEIKDDTLNDAYEEINLETKKSSRKKCALVITCIVLLLTVILAVAIVTSVVLLKGKNNLLYVILLYHHQIC